MLGQLALGAFVGQRMVHPEAIQGIPQSKHRLLGLGPGKQPFGAVAQGRVQVKGTDAPVPYRAHLVQRQPAPVAKFQPQAVTAGTCVGQDSQAPGEVGDVDHLHRRVKMGQYPLDMGIVGKRQDQDHARLPRKRRAPTGCPRVLSSLTVHQAARRPPRPAARPASPADRACPAGRAGRTAPAVERTRQATPGSDPARLRRPPPAA